VSLQHHPAFAQGLCQRCGKRIAACCILGSGAAAGLFVGCSQLHQRTELRGPVTRLPHRLKRLLEPAHHLPGVAGLFVEGRQPLQDQRLRGCIVHFARNFERSLIVCHGRCGRSCVRICDRVEAALDLRHVIVQGSFSAAVIEPGIGCQGHAVMLDRWFELRASRVRVAQSAQQGGLGRPVAQGARHLQRMRIRVGCRVAQAPRIVGRSEVQQRGQLCARISLLPAGAQRVLGACLSHLRPASPPFGFSQAQHESQARLAVSARFHERYRAAQARRGPGRLPQGSPALRQPGQESLLRAGVVHLMTDGNSFIVVAGRGLVPADRARRMGKLLEHVQLDRSQPQLTADGQARLQALDPGT